MEVKEEPCSNCKDLIKRSYPAPHLQLLEVSVMPDHKLFNCNQCGAFACLNLNNAMWEVELELPVEVEC